MCVRGVVCVCVANGDTVTCGMHANCGLHWLADLALNPSAHDPITGLHEVCTTAVFDNGNDDKLCVEHPTNT